MGLERRNHGEHPRDNRTLIFYRTVTLCLTSPTEDEIKMQSNLHTAQLRQNGKWYYSHGCEVWDAHASVSRGFKKSDFSQAKHEGHAPLEHVFYIPDRDVIHWNALRGPGTLGKIAGRIMDDNYAFVTDAEKGVIKLVLKSCNNDVAWFYKGTKIQNVTDSIC